MSWNAGAGKPSTFRCWRCRRRNAIADRGRVHRVVLTGKTKVRKHATDRHGRMNREYRCLDCGWQGWSTHIDLAHAREVVG
jgi:hypothetical protein